MERGADGVDGDGMYVYEHGKGAGNGESYKYDPATGHVYHIGEAIGSGDNTCYFSGDMDEMILAAARYADGASFPTIPESKVNSYPSWAGTCNE